MNKLSLRYAQKSLVDSFKPYKHINQIGRDIFQPFSGVRNILFGVYNCLLFVFQVALSPVFCPAIVLTETIRLRQKGLVNAFKSGLSTYFGLFEKSLKDSRYLALGLIQLSMSPLLAIIIPFRLILTAIYGTPSIIENKGLQRELIRHSNASYVLENGIVSSDQAQDYKVQEDTKKDLELARQTIHRKLVSYYWRNEQKFHKDAADPVRCIKQVIGKKYDQINQQTMDTAIEHLYKQLQCHLYPVPELSFPAAAPFAGYEPSAQWRATSAALQWGD